MYTDFQKHLQGILEDIKEAGLYKNERVIVTPQSSAIQVAGGKDVINFCANNHLGLADNQELIQAAKDKMDARGYGMASVRFICGTQDTHSNWSKPFLTSLALRIPFCTQPALMPTVDCSSHS